MHIPLQYGYLPAMVIIFLIVDLILEVGSLRALVANFYFWLYWLVYSIASGVALYLLRHVNNPAISSLPPLLLDLMATVGAATIMQSLTFKVGGKRVLELSRYLDDYRRKVLSSSARLVTRYDRKEVLRQSRRILVKADYQAGNAESEDRIRKIYAQVMLFGARDSARVEQEIAKIEQDCQHTGADFGPEIARRVAQTDPEWVRNYLAE